MQKTILAVDYDQRTLEEIQTILAEQDLAFLTAHDGSQAAELYKNWSPDLVLTSALLPKLNGFELCKKITSGELGDVRPVIMFSGIYKAEKYRKEAIVGCGAVEFLEKPLVQAHLTKVVRSLLSQPLQPRPKTLPEPNLPESFSPVDVEAVQLVPLNPPLEEQSSAIDVLEMGDIGPGISPETILEIDSNDSPQESLVLNPMPPETKPTLLPPDSQDEIEAALAAVLIDTDLEVRMRDRRIAEEIENEIATISQNILELEQALETSPGYPRSMLDDNEIIELDDREPSQCLPQTTPIVSETHSSSILWVRDGLEKSELPDETEPPKPVVPTFTLHSEPSRKWIPITIILLILFGLTVIFLFGSH